MKLDRTEANRFAVNRMMMLLCPALALLSNMIPMWTGTIDLVRYYAAFTLVVELGLFYIPTHRFISRRGGARAFGLVGVSAGECVLAAFLGLGMFALVNAITGGVQLAFRALGAHTVSAGAPLSTEGGWRLLSTILLVGILPAYIEESLFRGVLLFSWLPGGRARAVLHSAAIFALVHLNPISLPAVFLFGVVLALAASWSGSILPAAILHGVNNLAAIAFAYAVAHLPSEGTKLLESILARDYLLVLGASGVLLSALSLWGLRLAARKGGTRREAAALAQEAAAEEAPPDGEESPAPFLLPATLLRQQSAARRYLKLPVLLTYFFLIATNLFLLVYLFSEAMSA